MFDPGAPLSGERSRSRRPRPTTADRPGGTGTSTTAAAPTRRSVEHTYSVPGVYMVKLTVTDVESLTATHTRGVTVGNRNPVAEFHFSPAAPRSARRSRSSRTRATRRTGSTSQSWDLDDDGTLRVDRLDRVEDLHLPGGPHTVTLRVAGPRRRHGHDQQDGRRDRPAEPRTRPPRSTSCRRPEILDNMTFTSTSSDPDGSIVTTHGTSRTTASTTPAATRCSAFVPVRRRVHGAAARHGQRGRRSRTDEEVRDRRCSAERPADGRLHRHSRLARDARDSDIRLYVH